MDKCKGKTHYDTEFEATISAAKMTGSIRQEMKPYPCGRHFHIAHKRRLLRNKHLKIIHCDFCQCDVKVARWGRHIAMPAHLRKSTPIKDLGEVLKDERASDNADTVLGEAGDVPAGSL